jgi:dodecin
MNRRHSQSSNATPVKSLTMSDGANAAIGPSRRVQRFTHSVVIGGLIQINGQGGGEYPASCFQTEWEDDMPESVYDVILLIGSSKESWEKAAANAVEQASKSLRNLRVAEIVELDMQLDAKGKVEAYRAKVRLSFKVER